MAPNFSLIPRPALWLGAAGVLPFLWAVLTLVVPSLRALTEATFGPAFVGSALATSYGTIILAYMAGVLWGFAARAPIEASFLAFGASTAPALWIFFVAGLFPGAILIALILGFLGVLACDAYVARRGWAPPWWMALRVPLTGAVCLCLGAVTILG